MAPINQTTARRLWLLVKPFFNSEVKWQARGLLLLLACFSLSIAGLNVLLSYVARDFMTAFSLKEEDEFFNKLGLYLIAFAFTTPVSVFYSYTEQRLALLWRRWLSRQILGEYFKDSAYYRLSLKEGIDNPDQRIEEDIRSFTATALSLFLIFCNATLTLVLFVRILWSISFNLIGAVVLYALFGSAMTYLIGRPLVGLNVSQLKKEADYRYKLVNVRDNAESIAFSRGDKKEFTRVRQRLNKALENFRRIINVNRNLGFFVTFYNNLKPVLPIIIVSPLYLRGDIQFGVVTQAADAFVRVLEALSVLIQHFATISSVAAVVTRLGSFREALNDEGSSEVSKGDQTRIRSVEGAKVEFENITILTPRRGQCLVEDLSFSISSGGLLITGPSGAGKSSVLRVIGGLWRGGSGTVTYPPVKDTVFLPQRPYIVLGSLRNQLLYSLTRGGVSNREIYAALEEVELQALLKRVKSIDEFADWRSLLSAGEQQQLAFARLLLAKPRYVFLDEATTAIDTALGGRLYAKVAGITDLHVSVGFRATLGQFHNQELELLGGGKWQIRSGGAV